MNAKYLTDEDLAQMLTEDLGPKVRAVVESSITLRAMNKESQKILDVFRYLRETQSTATGLTYADLLRIYDEEIKPKNTNAE